MKTCVRFLRTSDWRENPRVGNLHKGNPVLTTSSRQAPNTEPVQCPLTPDNSDVSAGISKGQILAKALELYTMHTYPNLLMFVSKFSETQVRFCFVDLKVLVNVGLILSLIALRRPKSAFSMRSVYIGEHIANIRN